MIDLAVWISGDITSVSAHLASYGQRTDPEGRPFTEANQSAHLVVEFADGSHGSIHVSQMVVHTASRRREQNVSLHGEGGALEVDWYVGDLNFTEGLTLQGCRHDEQEYRVLAIPETFLMGAEAGVVLPVMQKHVVGPRLFVDAIARDYQPTPNFVQGVKVQKVIDAAMRSHQTGQRVLVKI